MSEVKNVKRYGRYVVAALALLLAVALIAGTPSAVSETGSLAGKAAGLGPQPNMPGGAASLRSDPVGVTNPPSAETGQGFAAPQGSAVVGHSIKNDVSPPLRDIPPAPYQALQEAPENRHLPIPHKNEHIADPVVQNWFGSLLMPTPIANFDGINSTTSGCGCYPPDTQGDVGPNHYVQWVNTSFQIFDKTGATLQAPRAGNTLWQGFGGACQINNDGDPITLYDPLADRWMMTQFTTSPPYYQCIAVSSSPDPLGTWNRYAFQVSATLLNDYPKFGVWPDGYYMTSNRFGAGYDSPAAIAFDRVRMLAGQPATFVLFNPGNYFYALLPSDLDGSTPPPAGAPNYFVTTAGTSNTMRLWKFHVDWTTPMSSTFTGPVNVITAPFDPYVPCTGPEGRNCIPQPGTIARLDAIAGQPMYRLAYRNFGDHESLVTNQTVYVGGTTGVRWYEVRDPGGRPYIYQQGTYSPDSTYRWMGSIAMDRDGDIALGFSASYSTTVYPSVRYTGRLVTDPLGTMPQGEAAMIAGGGSQTATGSRWGDYSMMSVDPVDDCTFWYTQEYYATTASVNWRTRIGSFKFPSCGQPTPTGTPPTATRTPTAAPTSTATATACANYTNATATATIEPGVTDIGNHCDDCTTYVTLPFPVQMYDRTFANAYVSSNGNLQFNSSDNAFGNACLPVPVFEYTIIAYWDDLIDNASGDGVFTSVTGAAPNRTYNVEWRAHILSTGAVARFEIRMFEGQPAFEMIYGTIGQPGTGQTVGLIRDMNTYTQFSCNTSSLSAGLKITWNAPPCYSFTPTPTYTPCPTCPTDTPTSTRTNTPTNTPTGSYTPTSTHTRTNTPTNTYTPTNTFTNTPTNTPTFTPTTTHTSTNTPTNTPSNTPISTATNMPTNTLTPTPCTINFSDVHQDDYFYEPVRYLYCHGVISGYGDGTFKPGNLTTRGQLAKIVVLAEGWLIYTPPTPTFRDVPTTDPFYSVIETAYNHSIISGYNCGGPGEPCPGLYYRPGNNVTRAQLCKIIVLAEGWPITPPGTPTFRDVPPEDGFYGYIETAYSHGIISGYSCGSGCLEFRPGNNATRGQIAKIVYLAVTAP